MREEKNQEEGFESEKKTFLKYERVENGKTFDSYKSEFKFKHLPPLPIPIPSQPYSGLMMTTYMPRQDPCLQRMPSAPNYPFCPL